MAYSNDEEMEKKLNNSGNLNFTVQDFPASNNEQAREEINQAKQKVLLEEAIENNDAYKRLKQNLARVTKGRIQVKTEEVAEIYQSMVSTNVNTVGKKGVFFVDDSLISQAVGGVCYDISIGESSGLVLHPDGRVNVEKSREKIVILGGQVPPEKAADFYTQLVEEKKGFLDIKNTNEDIKNEMKIDEKTDLFSRQLYGKSGADLSKALRNKKIIAEMNEANNSSEVKKSMSDNRVKANLETAEDVQMMEYAKSIYEYDKKIKESFDPREIRENEIKKLGLLKTIQQLADSGSEPAKKFVSDGKINTTAIIKSFEDYRDNYSSKEGIKFLMQFHPRKLAKFAEKPIDKLTLKQNQERQKIIKTAIAIYYSDSKEINRASRMTAYRYLTASGLTNTFGVKEDEVVKVLNLLMEKEQSQLSNVQKFNTFSDVRKAAINDFETEAVQNISNLSEEIKNGTFVNRTEEEVRRPKKHSKEEKEKIGLRKRINIELRKIYADARDDKISESLENLFAKIQVEEDVYKAAIIGKVYIYNLKKSLTESDPVEVRKYKENARAISNHVKNNQGRYRDIINKEGNINHRHIEKLSNDLNGFEINEWLKEQGVSEVEINEVFEESWREKKNPRYIARSMLKTAEKFVKSEYRYLKSTRVGQFFFGDIRNGLPNARGKEKGSFDAEESLTQEQIDLLIAQMQGNDISDEVKDTEKSFDEQLRDGVKVDERAALQKKTQEVAQNKAILKVDIATMKKEAFEICQKNDELRSVAVMINEMSVSELQELISLYGDKNASAIELQDCSKKQITASEGAER